MSNIWNFGENAGDVKHAVSGVTDDVIEQAPWMAWCHERLAFGISLQDN